MQQFVNADLVDCRTMRQCLFISHFQGLVQLSHNCCRGRSDYLELILQAKRRMAIGFPRFTGSPQFEPATARAKSSETKTYSLPSPVLLLTETTESGRSTNHGT